MVPKGELATGTNTIRLPSDRQITAVAFACCFVNSTCIFIVIRIGLTFWTSCSGNSRFWPRPVTTFDARRLSHTIYICTVNVGMRLYECSNTLKGHSQYSVTSWLIVWISPIFYLSFSVTLIWSICYFVPFFSHQDHYVVKGRGHVKARGIFDTFAVGFLPFLSWLGP